MEIVINVVSVNVFISQEMSRAQPTTPIEPSNAISRSIEYVQYVRRKVNNWLQILK